MTVSTKRSRLILLLLATNTVTMLTLIGTWHYFRLIPKAYQRLVVEGRVPSMVPSHQLNRSFHAMRDIHQLYDTSPVKTLVIGDSLVSQVSWPELMADPAIGGRGIPGDVSTGVLERIEDYRDISVDRVVLLVGTNDILQGRADTLLGTLQAIRTAAREQWSNAQIIQCTIPPVSAWIDRAEQANAESKLVNQQLIELSKQESFMILDLASELTDASGYLNGECTSDGIHLNATGYTCVRELLRQSLEDDNG